MSVNHGVNAELYKALSDGDDAKVCQICLELPNGPFHMLTIHNESVIHSASFYRRNSLVLELISQTPQSQDKKFTLTNESGSTILHAAATNNQMVGAAAEMLRRAPLLLTMKDKFGETALFRAARYGKTKIFHFLEDQVRREFPAGADIWANLQRDDKATILHVAINSENFELAHYIAETYPILIGQRDGDGMTALQLLACKPSAFDTEFKDNFFKQFLYKSIFSSPKDGNSRVPVVKQIRKKMLKSESAKKLATLLIKGDTSWAETKPMPKRNRIKPHVYGASATTTVQKMSSATDDIITYAGIPDSPLLLATKLGCTEIVKEILEVYPQAVEHIDEDGRHILHVAIKYRRAEIYEAVIKMKIPLIKLRGKMDNYGNSLLHMVAIKVRDQRAESDIRSPALVLRDDLILFENVKSICSTLTTLQVNNDGVTAEQLFIENNAQLRIDAKEWMKSTAQNCSVVAVLIATVAFAAAYTVPGGPNQSTGYPLLKKEPFFIAFAIADALSLTFSLTSVIIFLSILTSSFHLEDFKSSLHYKLLIGLTVLTLSVSMMMMKVSVRMSKHLQNPNRPPTWRSGQVALLAEPKPET
ncbi:ankyrin repeat-containing domain, PGG domain protein [Artemisia annua]|uniref:Ankyrin repeat-containing domain, PGG domain protein n=1 Tax=Artemisia annua TaxID=35608 RepID=A0A2U1LS69_ARTAN|nr:ankyrin repeat-containing domain, PGG domain protein [Artemisia annua]